MRLLDTGARRRKRLIPRMSRSRSWVFTLHGASVAELITTGNNLRLDNYCSYYIYQVELAPTTLAPHLQGFVHFSNQRALGGVKRILGATCHVEIARGTPEQCRAYCSKLESRAEGTDPVEWGQLPTQGSRSDLKGATELVRAGAPRCAIAEQFPEVVTRYGGGLERLRNWLVDGRERVEPPVVQLLWGRAGTGKTRFVYDNHAKGTVYRVIDTGAKFWWDGYDPLVHSCVLFDDWDCSHSFTQILQWIDRYPVQGEVKGGKVPLLFTHAYFTTNLRPEAVWLRDARREAFFRRLSNVSEVTLGNTAANVTEKIDNVAVADVEEVLAELLR